MAARAEEILPVLVAAVVTEEVYAGGADDVAAEELFKLSEETGQSEKI